MATKVNNLLRPQIKLLKKYCFKLLRKFDFHNYLRKQTLQSSVIIATLHLFLTTCSSIQAQAAVTGSMLAWSLWLGSLKPRTVVAVEGREGNSCPGPDQPQIIGTNSVFIKVSRLHNCNIYHISTNIYQYQYLPIFKVPLHTYIYQYLQISNNICRYLYLLISSNIYQYQPISTYICQYL